MFPMTPTANMRQDRSVLMYLKTVCMEVVCRQLGGTWGWPGGTIREELVERGRGFGLCTGFSFSLDGRALFTVSCATRDSVSDTWMRLWNLGERGSSLLGEPSRLADDTGTVKMWRTSKKANSKYQATKREPDILNPDFSKIWSGRLRKSQVGINFVNSQVSRCRGSGI